MKLFKIKQLIIIVCLASCLPQLVSAQDKTLAAGIELFKAKNFSQAEEYFIAFIERNPNHALALYYLGRAEYEKLVQLRPANQNLYKDARKESGDKELLRSESDGAHINFDTETKISSSEINSATLKNTLKTVALK